MAKELDDLGIHLNKDQFTRGEQVLADAKLDEILDELEKVKKGQMLTLR